VARVEDGQAHRPPVGEDRAQTVAADESRGAVAVLEDNGPGAVEHLTVTDEMKNVDVGTECELLLQRFECSLRQPTHLDQLAGDQWVERGLQQLTLLYRIHARVAGIMRSADHRQDSRGQASRRRVGLPGVDAADDRRPDGLREESVLVAQELPGNVGELGRIAQEQADSNASATLSRASARLVVHLPDGGIGCQARK